MLDQQPAIIPETSGATAAKTVQRTELNTYERVQRQATLNIIIWTVFTLAVVLGAFDIQFRTWVSVYSLFGMALLCIPTLLLNRKGNYRLAASLLSLIVIVVLSMNLYDGDGVRDPGIMAYPLFILAGVLFFGRRAVPYFAGVAILSLVAIVGMEVSGIMHPSVGPTRWSILIPMGSILIAAAGIVRVTVANLEKNLERARDSEAELSQNYDLTLQAWAQVLEYRDRDTEGHSRRLVELATRLAQALGMSAPDIVHLQRGALLHDIGKLAIPDDILLKPSTLDETEMNIMHKHPVFAKQMLEGIPFLAPAVPVAYSHHERWDGKGYPEGLAGERIPLPARIFAVVDTWDALSSERVYRPAWPPEQVKAYIKLNSGSRFDPNIARLFLDLVEHTPPGR